MFDTFHPKLNLNLIKSETGRRIRRTSILNWRGSKHLAETDVDYKHVYQTNAFMLSLQMLECFVLCSQSSWCHCFLHNKHLKIQVRNVFSLLIQFYCGMIHHRGDWKCDVNGGAIYCLKLFFFSYIRDFKKRFLEKCWQDFTLPNWRMNPTKSRTFLTQNPSCEAYSKCCLHARNVPSCRRKYLITKQT